MFKSVHHCNSNGSNSFLISHFIFSCEIDVLSIVFSVFWLLWQFCTCDLSKSGWLNASSQKWHVKILTPSSWTLLMCFLRYHAVLKALSQMSHLYFFCDSWTFLMWFITFPGSLKALPQISHLWFFSPSWTLLMCLLRLTIWLNNLPHKSHLWIFRLSWTLVICNLR